MDYWTSVHRAITYTVCCQKKFFISPSPLLVFDFCLRLIISYVSCQIDEF